VRGKGLQQRHIRSAGITSLQASLTHTRMSKFASNVELNTLLAPVPGSMHKKISEGVTLPGRCRNHAKYHGTALVSLDALAARELLL